MNDQVSIIPNISGDRTTPSYVSFSNEKDYVGEEAKNIARNNIKKTIFDSKRLIGRKYLSFEISQKSDGKPFYKISKENNEI